MEQEQEEQEQDDGAVLREHLVLLKTAQPPVAASLDLLRNSFA